MLPSVARARFQKLLNMFRLGDAESFKREMDVCDCIISGSAALYVIHPTTFVPNHLDFYVPVDSAFDFEYALHKLGYRKDDDEDNPPHYGNGPILLVLRLRKAGVVPTINLIITSTTNPLKAIVQFHTTLVMNVITSEGIICLYTLLYRVAHILLLLKLLYTNLSGCL
ncbi:hypothetical protein CVT26_012850 [Gymnopilus dilepis]|uniref:Uncharacterized protein n=1 Tax=Gymnopilus dilepis TaxID=231916 RepID=A0A409Y437_9AGAR|nr:hypothetical protein CVT26_012850 [Gymnopilus dilepis]